MAWSQEGREIWRHAMVGGAVAFVLVESERVEKWMTVLGLEHQPWLENVFLALIAFAFAFSLVVGLERWSRRKVPIDIPDLEDNVDGTWVNAVVHNGQLVGVSWLTIDSSKATERFRIRGQTYDIKEIAKNNFRVKDDPKNLHGEFESTEGSLFGRDGISYPFKGAQYVWTENATKKIKEDRFGVVYYRFEKRENELFLKGAFLSRQENSVSQVTGRRVEFKSDRDKEAQLRGWVNTEVVSEFENKCLQEFDSELHLLAKKYPTFKNEVLTLIREDTDFRAAVAKEVAKVQRGSPMAGPLTV